MLGSLREGVVYTEALPNKDHAYNWEEWLYDSIMKRTRPPYNIPLKELFLVAPHEDEAEFDFEVKPTGRYPLLPRGKLRVFFLKPHKLLASTGEAAAMNAHVKGLNLATPRLLWTRKFNYPKISQVKSAKSLRT